MIPQQNRERQLIPLTFNRRTVRTVLIDGVPWFVAKDVCDILEIANPRKAIQDFPENERNTVTISDGIHKGPGNPNINAVNEPGLYRLIFQSRKPEAEQFKTWVFASVLPQIRQTGFFFPDAENLGEQQLALVITRYFASRLPDERAAVKIGKCLALLKSHKRHGEYLPCLALMGISPRSAARYMQIYRHSLDGLFKRKKRKPLKQPGLFEQPAGKPPAPFCLPLLPAKPLSLIRFNNELPMAAY